MKSQLMGCIRKDFLEYLRTKRNVLFAFTVLMLCIMVLLATMLIPSLVSILVNQASHTIANPETIATTLASIFPKDLKSNMGILSSDIVVFYGIVVILSTYNLVVKEIRDGKWIFPLSVGYSPFVMLVSKGIVYGIGAALPVIIFYNLYFVIGGLFLIPNFEKSFAFVNSAILSFSMFSIVYITILLSALHKQAIAAAVTMILFIITAPDIFSLFSFGRYLPTHLLTYTYLSNDNVFDTVIPFVMTVVLQIILTIFSAKSVKHIEVSR